MPIEDAQWADAPPSRAADALETIFGFPGFRPGQEEIIEAILAGENILAIMPTGAGKSLLYQLPSCLRDGLTIVISPLIALMRDQVRQLERHKVSAAALNSANTESENRMIAARLLEGRYRLLYVAPERFVHPETIALLRLAKANVLAIDEAHCVAQWGHEFRPEYLALAKAARMIGELQLVAVTATADPSTRAEIIEKVFPAPPKVFVRSFDRPNIRLAFARRSNAPRQIALMIARHRGESGIVYCATRKGVERLSACLSAAGIPALPYHAGLEADRRSANQDEFLSTQGTVIVATIAFGMGVDKPDVRFVCHADLPQSVEAYYHETGRAGRDGLASDTLTLFNDSDFWLRERKFIEDDLTAHGEREWRKLDGMRSLCEAPRCRRETLLAAFGEATSGPCGNCDLCEARWPMFNEAGAALRRAKATLRRATRPVLMRRFAERLAAGANAAIARHGGPSFTSFAALKPAEWKSLIAELHRAGLIVQDLEDPERFAFTEAGEAHLAGRTLPDVKDEVSLSSGRKASLRLALEEILAVQAGTLPVAPPPFTARAPNRAAQSLTAAEHNLLSALKAKRLEIARQRRVAPGMILHDGILVEMARRRPRTDTEFLALPGMEAEMARRLGTKFLEVVKAHDV
jgi:ATP-dependent DNA helicase RecQ